MLADVLEHLDDPVDALRRIAGLLVPGGVTLIVTPDPASRTARLAGSRWWGYLPSHTYLIPHATLRGLLRDAGLEPVEEKPLLAHVQLRLLDRWAGRALGPGAGSGEGGGEARAGEAAADVDARRRARGGGAARAEGVRGGATHVKRAG